jgi:hypothetical protein
LVQTEIYLKNNYSVIQFEDDEEAVSLLKTLIFQAKVLSQGKNLPKPHKLFSKNLIFVFSSKNVPKNLKDLILKLGNLKFVSKF